MVHPSRHDDDLFEGYYRGYNPFRSLWLRYVPRWVDTALRWLIWLFIAAAVAIYFW